MTETASTKIPRPSAEHQRLEAFVGTWLVEGESFAESQNPDDPRASAVAWSGEDSWQWLPGGFFLRHEGHAQLGTHTLVSSEIIGHDGAKGGYFSRMFDNAGFHPEYEGAVEGDVWTFSDPSSRSRMVFSEGGNRLKIDWEWRHDGSDWLPLCDLVATRAAVR